MSLHTMKITADIFGGFGITEPESFDAGLQCHELWFHIDLLAILLVN
jgi:hypothetical protein